MKAKEPAQDLLDKKTDLAKQKADVEVQMTAKESERDSKLILIGNLVHDSVPRSNDEVRSLNSLIFLIFFLFLLLVDLLLFCLFRQITKSFELGRKARNLSRARTFCRMIRYWTG